MAITVDDIQSDVAAVVDQDQDVNNIDSDDYALRLNYINSRERSWAEIGKFQALYKEYNTLTSTNSGNVSISLPSDYRSLAGYPKISYDGVNAEEFPEIKPTAKGQYVPSSDRFIYILGNKNAGYTMVVNPEYITNGVIADVWESREDARYQAKQIEATTILKNMIEQEFTASEASADSRIKTVDQTRHNYRWGE